MFYSLGEYQNAKEYLEKALAIAIEIGDRGGEGSAYSNLGTVYSNLNKNRQAKEHLDKAVGVSIAIGDRQLEATAIVGLAHVSASVNDIKIDIVRRRLQSAENVAIEIAKHNYTYTLDVYPHRLVNMIRQHIIYRKLVP